MDNAEIGQAFLRGGKQEDPLDTSGLTVRQLAYSKAVYRHLRALTEGYRKASNIVRLIRQENGLEAWRNSPVGDSDNNGRIEKAIRELEGVARTLRSAFEERIGKEIDLAHPITPWLICQAANALNRYQVRP